MRLTTDEQEWRITQSVKNWNRMSFFTATLVEEEHDPKVISARWTEFIKLLKRYHCPGLRVIRVLQKHEKGHGWHIHALLDRYIPHHILRHLRDECGLGRMDFKMVTKEGRHKAIGYLVRYLVRDMRNRWRETALKGVRVLTASGHLRSTQRWWLRLSDITIVDTGNDARRVLQRLYERFLGCVFRNSRGQPFPMPIEDMIANAPRYLLDEWEWECAERRRKGLIVGVTPKG